MKQFIMFNQKHLLKCEILKNFVENNLLINFIIHLNMIKNLNSYVTFTSLPTNIDYKSLYDELY